MDFDGVFYCARCMRKIEKEDTCPHCGFDNRTIHNASPALDMYTVLNERYQICSVIGRGGFGITYAAWDEKLCIPVAIKEYMPKEWTVRNSSEKDAVTVLSDFQKAYLIGKERFLRESRVLAMLQEISGIVKVYDCFEENETAYIVMEYVHGTTVGRYVQENRMPPKELLRMMKQPIDALAAIHKQGVLHRDITPNNILVQEDGSVKLIDFGSAAHIGRQNDTIVLTQHYAPIEQYGRENKKIGPWTDVYGISATLYTLLTGKVPQESVVRMQHDEIENIGRESLEIKAYQRKAIKKGLVIQPEKRTQSMEEFRAALYNIPMPEEVLRRKKFMRRVEAAVAAVVGLFLVILINFTCGFPLGRGLLYSLRQDGFHIVSEINFQEERVLPESRMGIPVSSVDESAFAEDATLRSLTVPDSIKRIGSMAFYHCRALKQVTLGDGVRQVGGYAFAECGDLNTVNVSSDETAFTKDIFEGSSDQITVWGSRGSLAEESLKESEINFAVREEYGIKQGEKGVILTECRDHSAKLVMPSVIDGQYVTELSSSLKIADTVEEIVLPDHLQRLDAGALSGKEQLRKVTLGSETTILGAGALKYSGIEELVVSGYLEEIGEEALRGTHVRELDLPHGLKKIGRKAFSEAFLDGIVLPDGVEEMGEQVFSACVNLREVYLPEGIAEVGKGTFENCMRLEHVYIPSTAKAIRLYAFRGCHAMETLLIPENIDEIDAYAFADCTSLKYVAMPEVIEQGNVYMFDGCPNDMVLSGNGDHAAKKLAELKQYLFEDESKWSEKVLIGSKGYNVFAMEEIAEPEVIMPSYNRDNQSVITEVWSVSEMGNDTIRSVVLPRYSTSVATKAFANLTGLESVELSETLQDIGKLAFAGCLNLKQINIPENVKLIDSEAFMNCRNLTELMLPDSVNHISENAFLGCEQIKELSIPNGLVLLPDGAFGRTGIEHVVIPGNISKVRCAFFECGNLRSVEMQEGVRSLWESFAGCSALETVTIPASLEIMTQNTFAGCSSLKDVTFYADDFVINKLPFVKQINTYKENEDGTLVIGEVQSIMLPHDGEALDHLFADCPDVTIHAHKGSKMEQYAYEYGLKFEALNE